MRHQWKIASALILSALSFGAANAQQRAPDSLPGCQYNATPPTLGDKQTIAWQCDINGKLITSGGGGLGTVTSIATTSPITGGTITTTGTIACATCVTSAAALTANSLMIGSGSQASAVTTTGTGVLTALGVNVGSVGALVTNGGALGTPSSGTATNMTGTATGLTAGSVTTNANLTGPITSVGNATAIASQTGTGATFVVDTSPTLVTPVLGVATATSITASGLLQAGTTIGISTDVLFNREAANTPALRNGANAQNLRIYNTYTDGSNYERAGVGWFGNVFYVSTTNAGSGTVKDLAILSASNLNLTANGGTDIGWRINTSGHFLALADNTYDIGAFAATRPRNLFLAGTATIAGVTSITNTTDSTTTTSGALQVAGGFAVRKRVFIDGITVSAGLQTAVLCQSSGGEMIADTVACLASAARFKDVRGPMPDGALARLARLPIDLWAYKAEGKFSSDDWTRERIGPLADDVAAMDPRLVGYDNDGNVRTYSTEQLLAYTIKALQELKADNDNLRQEVRRIAR